MRKHLAAAGIAVGSIVGGIALGATVFTPTVVSAQEAEDGTTETETTECRRPGRGPGLAAAAEAIGIEVDALKEALEAGQTIADVAAANGVDVQTVIDAMVAGVQEHLAAEVAEGELTQEEADERLEHATERITAKVNGEEPARPEGGRRGPRGERPEAPADES